MQQGVYIATGCPHCYRVFTLLQGVHIATGSSHSYRVFTLLQGVHFTTGCSGDCRVRVDVSGHTPDEAIQGHTWRARQLTRQAGAETR